MSGLVESAIGARRIRSILKKWHVLVDYFPPGIFFFDDGFEQPLGRAAQNRRQFFFKIPGGK